MTVEKFIENVRNCIGRTSDTGGAWVKIGSSSYLVRDVEIDGEGDIVIRVNPTPY